MGGDLGVVLALGQPLTVQVPRANAIRSLDRWSVLAIALVVQVPLAPAVRTLDRVSVLAVTLAV